MLVLYANERSPWGQSAALSHRAASIAFVLLQAPSKRAALSAERDSSPINPPQKQRKGGTSL